MKILSKAEQIQREKAIMMGLFISKYSERAYESFGFSSFKEAYNVFGYSVGYPPTSIKHYQQEFDRFFPNDRTGWTRPVRAYCMEVYNKYKNLTFEEFQMRINSFLVDDYVDIKDIKSSATQRMKRHFSANRLLTGKAAEKYFVLNYQHISPFTNFLLTDTTNMGCGFDYKLTLEPDNYYVEVKGLAERQGKILMTEKEFNMAEDLLDRYCLFVVCNFKDVPKHQMFFDPIHCGTITFQRQERQLLHVSYQSNII